MYLSPQYYGGQLYLYANFIAMENETCDTEFSGPLQCFLLSGKSLIKAVSADKINIPLCFAILMVYPFGHIFHFH